jgi:restriction system protein
MVIPGYQSIMLPLLTLAGDSKEHSLRESIQFLAAEFGLSEKELTELLPSGKQTVFDNRVGWARTYMKKAGLLESPKRAFFRITTRGLDVLKSTPTAINVEFLEQFPEFMEFKTLKHEKDEGDTTTSSDHNITPEESLESAFQNLRQSLASDVLQEIKSSSPQLFERLVVQLLVSMGYGGTLKDAGQAVGKSGDEGIDGIIKEDRLGLDTIFIQAKKWDNTVGRPEIQKFAGALQGQRARKGIFITTADFSKDAYEYVSRIDSKIVLINGAQLAEFMIDHNIGVAPVASYEVKRLDHDFFAED